MRNHERSMRQIDVLLKLVLGLGMVTDLNFSFRIIRGYRNSENGGTYGFGYGKSEGYQKESI
jgi:hypothetical protein